MAINRLSFYEGHVSRDVLMQELSTVTAPPSKRTVAEVMRLVEGTYYRNPTSGMCRAVYTAYRKGVISIQEYADCTEAIDVYIDAELGARGVSFLFRALMRRGLSYHENACRDIYRDWDNRPKVFK